MQVEGGPPLQSTSGVQQASFSVFPMLAMSGKHWLLTSAHSACISRIDVACAASTTWTYELRPKLGWAVGALGTAVGAELGESSVRVGPLVGATTGVALSQQLPHVKSHIPACPQPSRQKTVSQASAVTATKPAHTAVVKMSRQDVGA